MSILKLKNSNGQIIDIPVIKGENGKDGKDGADGISVTHTWGGGYGNDSQYNIR